MSVGGLIRRIGLVYACFHIQCNVAVLLRGFGTPVVEHNSPTCKERPLVPKAPSEKFKVLQLADIHLGEFLHGKCDSEQDHNTFAAINDLLDEEQPDLIVFSGDQLTGEDSRSNDDRECLLDKLYSLLDARKVHWVTIFGNHDACAHPGCRTSARTVALASGLIHASPAPAAAAASPGPTKMQVEKAYGRLVKAHHAAIDDIIGKQLPQELPVASNISSQIKPDAVDTPMASPCAGNAPAIGPLPTVPVVAPTTTSVASPPTSGPALTSTAALPIASTTVPVAVVGNASVTQDKASNLAASSGNSKSATAESDSGNDNQMLIFHALDSHDDRQKQGARSRYREKDWRQQYLRREKAAECSLTGVDGVFESEGGGVSNFRLKVFASNTDAEADKPSFILWFLDTGGGEIPEGLQKDQLEWLRRESAEIEKQYGSVPGALYMHIPLAEFSYTGPPSSICKGASDDQVTPWENGLKLLPLLNEMHVNWIFAGHNHGNDWCCKIQESSHAPGEKVVNNIQLCYGHHSGFGGYSSPSIHQTGARVFEFNPSMARKFLLHQARDTGAHSYVRLRYGGVVADVDGM